MITNLPQCNAMLVYGRDKSGDIHECDKAPTEKQMKAMKEMLKDIGLDYDSMFREKSL